MKGNEYQRLAMRTVETDESESLLVNGVMGLNGEAGECIDIVKKWMFQGHEIEREKFIDELGDVAWYLAIAAYAVECPLEDVLIRNIEKLKKRYPDGFEAAKSINRCEG